MSASAKKPVLIIGGSGIVGSKAAKILRQLHPELPITIGGRDLAKADAVAREIGGAEGARIDLERPDLGLPATNAYSAIAMFLKDDSLNSLKYAQTHGAAYLSISSGTFEIAPEVAHYIHQPKSAPILMASQWLAGTATLPTLHFANEFQTIDSIEIAALLDEQDMGGPAAYADYERITKAAPSSLILKNGKWLWATGEDAVASFKSVDGIEMQAQAYSPLDIASLAAATDAASIRLDLAVGESASRRRGEPFSTEIIITITGQRKDGSTARVRHEIVHPAGQAPLTALGVALGIERLLGLAGGAPAAPGLYLPNVLIDPAYMVQRMEEFGARIRRAD